MSILDNVKAETPPRSTGNGGDSEVALEDLKRDLCLCKAELEKRADRIKALEEENDALKTHRRSKQTSGVEDENMGDGSLAEAERPRLPVELLVVISEFLLGDSLFGTLASLNTTCHVVHQETAPVLNETLVLDVGHGWWNERLHSEEDLRRGPARRQWKQTKYVISERGDLYQRRNELFPKLKVWVTKHSETCGTYPANLPVCTAEVVIHKPVEMETIWSLLQLPLHWPLNGFRLQIPIQGISKVRLENGGHVTGALDLSDNYLRFANPCFSTDFDLGDVESSPLLERTMMHLSRLMQPSDFQCTRRNEESEFPEPERAKLADRVLGFQFGADDAVYYAMLPALDAILARGIAVDVKIQHSESAFITHQQIRARMVATGEVYKRNFHIIREARNYATADDQFFFMRGTQAESDLETEGLDEDFHWPRTLSGEIFFHDTPQRGRGALWIFVESGSVPFDSYAILDQTIQP